MFAITPPADFETYINVEEGLARIRGNKTVYKAMLAAFMKDKSHSKLEEALSAADTAAAEEAAHALKGMAGNLSFPAVFRLSTELDLLLKQGERAPELEQELREAVAKTAEYVEWLQTNLQ